METLLSQIVIYGANGWLGRSSIESVLRLFPDIDSENLLLIGSRDSQVKILDKEFRVYNPVLGESRVKENSIFLNCALLRREYVERLGEKDFLLQNKKIMELPKRVLDDSKVSSFVNLSSGVVALESRAKDFKDDPYAYLKKQSEINFARFCEKNETSFLNCRVYSVSGAYLNEFENLALSSFINQALTNKFNNVESPDTKRVYIDGVNLMTILI
jgi:nucleoside-diphosphate-sugar epimerase